RNIYVDTITANSISAGNSDISGTISGNFTFNSDNLSNDAEDITLIFDRGLQPNALFTWNSTDDRFEFDQDVAVTTLGAGVVRSNADGLLSSDATTTDLPEGSNLYYTDDRARDSLSEGTGIDYDPDTGVIALDGAFGTATYFAQGGNSFSALAVLGTNDSNALSFETNNTERMRILANGNVAIGSTSADPFARGYSGMTLALSSAAQTGLAINSATSSNAYLDMGVNGTRLFAITSGSAQTSLSTTTSLPLVLGANNGSHVMITSAGDVGIGTSPLYRLHVHSGAVATTDQATGFFQNGATNATTDGINKYGVYIISTGTFTGGAGTATKNYGLYVEAPTGADNNYAAVFAGGNVGIGTANPTTKLSVLDTSTTSDSLFVYNTGATYEGSLIVGATEAVPSAAFNLLRLRTGVATQFLVRGNGTVGIGTDTPSAKLQIGTTASTTTGLLVYGSDGTSSTTLANFLDNGSNSRFYIRGDGAIGMGTTSPDGSFEVRNSSGTGIYTTVSNTSTGYARTFYKRNSAYSGSIGSDTSGGFGLSSGGGTANHLSIDASGNVGVGTTAPGARLDAMAPAADSTALRLSNPSASASYTELLFGVQASARSVGIASFIRNYTNGASNYGSELAFGTSLTTPSGEPIERMRITSAGNVGIGTISPSYPLHIVRPAGSSGSLRLEGDDLTLGMPSINFYNSNGGSSATLAWNGAQFTLNDDASITGSLGVGTASPFSKLDVATSSTQALTVGNTADTITNGDMIGALAFVSRDLSINSSGAIGSIRSYATADYNTGSVSGDLRFYVQSNGMPAGSVISGTEAMRITSAGTVGIGTASPDGMLHVHTSSGGTITPNVNATDLIVEKNGNAGMSILNPDAYTGSIVFGSPSDAFGSLIRWDYTSQRFMIGTQSAGAHFAITSGNGAEAMRITSDGSVGIGTTSPSEKLHIASSGGNFTPSTAFFGGGGSVITTGGEPAYVVSQDINSSGLPTGAETALGGMGFIYLNSGDYNNFRIGTQTNHSMIFRTNNLDRMTILNTGNVGIGTTTPGTNKLHIYSGASGGTPYTAGGLVVENSSRATIQLLAPSNADSYLFFGDPSSSLGGYIGHYGPSMSPANLMVYNSVGNHSFLGGHVGIGINAPTAPLHIYYNNSVSTNLILQTGSSNTDYTWSSVILRSNGVDRGAGMHIPVGSTANWYAGTLYGSGDTFAIARLAGGENGAVAQAANAMLTVSNGGVVSVGAGGGTLSVPGTGSGSIIFYSAYSGSPANPGFVINNYAGTNTFYHNSNGGSTYTSGTLSAGSLLSCGGIQTNGSGTMSCTSDERLKDVEGEFTSGLEAIREINPIAFSWKENSGLYDDGIVYYGFSAQNVQGALPEAISMSSGNRLQVSQLTLMATAINAIKEMDINVTGIAEMDRDNSWRDALLAWFADATNGIESFVAGSLRAKTEICIDDVCVDKEQLREIIQQNGAANAGGSSGGDEESDPDPAPEPDPTPAPDSEPEPTPDPTPQEDGPSEEPAPESEPTPEPEPIPETAPNEDGPSEELAPESEPSSTE
ncbi:MAG TPA: tail fiber domain-containing protein, partial [Candidatus Paceibacterota bacterium]